MTPEKKNVRDFQLIGAAICFGCGVYELMLATEPSGHGWQFLAGIAFVAFGLARFFYLVREKPTEKADKEPPR